MMISAIHLYRSLVQRIPFYVFIVYIYKEKINKKTLKFVSMVIPNLIVSATVILMYGWFTGVSFIDYLGFKWSYDGALEWCFFNIAMYTYGNRVIKDNPWYVINFMAQASCVGGWLYEAPYFLAKGEVIKGALDFVFLITQQHISFLFLYKALKDMGFTINRKIVGASLLYLAYSIPCYLNKLLFSAKIARIPTMILLLTLITGLNPPKTALTEVEK